MKDEVVVQQMGNIVVITMHGECNDESAVLLEKHFQLEILRRTRYILLDCTYTTSFSPGALRCVLSQSSEADRVKTSIILYQLSKELVRIMEGNRLSTVLHIVPTFQDAYKYCKEQDLLSDNF